MMGFHEATRPTTAKLTHSPACLNEEYYVADATRARMLVMFYRTLIETRPSFAAYEPRQKCPMLKCFKYFSQPTELMLHLYECEKLSYGEVECWKCSDWHEFPNSEKGWAAKLDPKKKAKSVRKSTSQLFRKLSGRRGSHHKDVQVDSHVCGVFRPSLDEILPPGMEEEILSSIAADPAPSYALFVPDKTQQFEADSTDVMELPVTQSTNAASRSPPEFSYSEFLGVSAISPLATTGVNINDRSSLPSQTYSISPRSTADDGMSTSQTRGPSLALQTDVIIDSQFCRSPETLQPDHESESPSWMTEMMQKHDGRSRSPERTLSGSTLQDSSADLYHYAPLSANFASLPISQPHKRPSRHSREWKSVSSSGSYGDSTISIRGEYSPTFSVSSKCGNVETGPGVEQEVAELDGNSIEIQSQPDNTKDSVIVPVTRQTSDGNKRTRDLVCEECGYRPSGLERNKRSHMSRPVEADPEAACETRFKRHRRGISSISTLDDIQSSHLLFSYGISKREPQV